MNILTIKQVFERKMAGLGIEAEITFISQGMLSIFVECERSYQLAKKLLSTVSNIALHSEDCDEEIGYFAYYTF
ncbi:hypothetical protein [Burkholderia phage BCSR52]|jgi:hypothetical protein|uniref:Uncharacterized protein n=1 Tax=Burkholderia phage BCSR52 TaxID=2805748 RepID=A0A889IQJ1_9CAUD|nr:hypothetical protein [Burkholderia phage BCSR52]DAP64249.1 MAG TPA: hypothetical protein [Caudoviricetes sp.]